MTPKSWNSSHDSSHNPRKHGIRVEAPRPSPHQPHYYSKAAAPISSTRSDTSSTSKFTPLRHFTSNATPIINNGGSEWEQMMTPVRQDTFDGDDSDTERDWYEGADAGDGLIVDLTHNPLKSFESSAPPRRLTAKQAAFARDNDRWESNRLEMIGGQRKRGFDAQQDDDHQRSQVQLILHDCLPPFMQPGASHAFLGSLITDGANGNSGTVKAIVEPFRDATSDMAVIARKGSAAVRSMRERRERKRLMKTLEGNATTLGALMGKKEETEPEAVMGDISSLGTKSVIKTVKLTFL